MIKDWNQVDRNRDLSSKELEKPSPKGQSKLVSRILSPAVQLWLRSQLQKVEYLQVKIEGSDRQLLRGAIPKISLIARAAIYQGLHLTEVKVAAESIGIDLGRVLRGKPLRILAPFPVNCELELTEADFNASLESPMLANAVIDFLTPLLLDVGLQLPINLANPQIIINSDRLTLLATILDANSAPIPLLINLTIGVEGDGELIFQLLDLQLSSQQKKLPSNTIKTDLGSDVEIEQLTLIPGKLAVKGKLAVRP
ncbi:MAG: DUF2993 domain-containing protein [Okeania sp. SIO2H7]|nr:DUF2993 domain-containing protein [Okeania sp. SIO2H7]